MFRFLRDRSGAFSIAFAILMMAIATTIGFAVDYSIFNNQRLAMKQSLEAGVLAAAREAPVQGWDEKTISAVVDRFVDLNLRASAFGKAEYILRVKPMPDRGRVHATLLQNNHGYFFLGHFRKNPQITVHAEAALVASANICVLSLNPGDTGAVFLAGQSSLHAKNCGVFANSTDAAAITVEMSSKLSADQICSAGGYKARPGDVAPQPNVDCPTVPDPLAGREPPKVGACDHTNLSVEKSATLHPGVYCGGLTVKGAVKVKLMPGVYVIKDGPWQIKGNATLIGEHVGFYLTGDTSTMSFENSSNIALTAPRSGPMAGILMFEDRSAPLGRVFEISSKDAEMLLGTIYLPRGTLLVRGKNKFAGAAAWTAVIAQDVVADKGPLIELNSDYGATDIPVPVGIGDTAREVRLTK